MNLKAFGVGEQFLAYIMAFISILYAYTEHATRMCENYYGFVALEMRMYQLYESEKWFFSYYIDNARALETVHSYGQNGSFTRKDTFFGQWNQMEPNSTRDF